MISVGITGGIGSGKTTVCRFFELLRVPVYYADVRAKALMNEDEALIESISTVFGAEAYRDGQLNRSHLAAQVFGNAERLEQLNALVHPAVAKDAAQWVMRQSAPYILYEAAILFESGRYKAFQKVIAVYAPEEMRIDRVVRRDGISREAVRDRIAHQMPEEEKLRLADYVIYNDLSQSLISQIFKIHKELLQLSDS